MRYLLLFAGCFLFRPSFAQYKVDTMIRAEYRSSFARLPGMIRLEEDKKFKKGLCILTGMKADTLNKNELLPDDNFVKIYPVNPKTGEKEPNTPDSDQDDFISDAQPVWLACHCEFKADTLTVTATPSVFPDFSVVISLSKGSAKAVYGVDESEDTIFKTDLAQQRKVNRFVIPASLDFLTLDREPSAGMTEIYGKTAVTTNGYYSYGLDAVRFRHEYMYKRMKIRFYFRCAIATGVN